MFDSTGFWQAAVRSTGDMECRKKLGTVVRLFL